MTGFEKLIKVNRSGELSTKKVKVLFKFFVFFFLISFLIFNWNEISWVFDYNFLASTFSNFFSRGYSKNQKKFQEAGSLAKYTEKEDGVFIPKIQIEAPLVFSSSDNPEDIEASLKKGVMHYPHSSLPGEGGEVIILGHTASSNLPETSYYSVFNRLIELEENDEVFVYFQNREYDYKVVKKFFVKEAEKLPSYQLTNSESVLLLMGCWPLGQRSQRIIVEAKEVI